jgi:hypothetical protein
VGWVERSETHGQLSELHSTLTLDCDLRSLIVVVDGGRFRRRRAVKLAKSRKWTDVEVQRAIAEIKKEPNLWEELEKIEKTTGDFRGTPAGLKEQEIVASLHRDCELNELTDLHVAIRRRRRTFLGP